MAPLRKGSVAHVPASVARASRRLMRFDEGLASPMPGSMLL